MRNHELATYRAGRRRRRTEQALLMVGRTPHTSPQGNIINRVLSKPSVAHLNGDHSPRPSLANYWPGNRSKTNPRELRVNRHCQSNGADVALYTPLARLVAVPRSQGSLWPPHEAI